MRESRCAGSALLWRMLGSSLSLGCCRNLMRTCASATAESSSRPRSRCIPSTRRPVAVNTFAPFRGRSGALSFPTGSGNRPYRLQPAEYRHLKKRTKERARAQGITLPASLVELGDRDWSEAHDVNSDVELQALWLEPSVAVTVQVQLTLAVAAPSPEGIMAERTRANQKIIRQRAGKRSGCSCCGWWRARPRRRQGRAHHDGCRGRPSGR
jgi:hypothetical protein